MSTPRIRIPYPRQIRTVSNKARVEEDVRGATILVCPYSQLASASAAIEARQFRVCVADESANAGSAVSHRAPARSPPGFAEHLL